MCRVGGDMTRSNTSASALAALLPLVCAVAGCCCQAYPLPGEATCPTDARRLYCSAGEEAVRRCPCGPDREFYGLKPTIWRPWPAGWRCDEGEWGGETFGETLVESPGEALPLENAPKAPQPHQHPLEPLQSDPAPAAPLDADEITLPGSLPPLEEGAPQTTPTEPESTKRPPRPAPRPAPMMPDTDDGALLLDSKLPLALNAPEIMRRAAATENKPFTNDVTQPAGGGKEQKISKKQRRDNPTLSNRVEHHLTNTLTL